ncbi:hypothetical protein FJ957_26470 [Mesorhizobium sp. B2-4-6]|nr:hypothetical protein FJ957_26470 [Mesorhizobium sp. B2-4-6]
MEAADRTGLELLLELLVAFDLSQPRNTMALWVQSADRRPSPTLPLGNGLRVHPVAFGQLPCPAVPTALLR